MKLLNPLVRLFYLFYFNSLISVTQFCFCLTHELTSPPFSAPQYSTGVYHWEEKKKLTSNRPSYTSVYYRIDSIG